MSAAVSYPPTSETLIRPAHESEHKFVRDSWCKSYDDICPSRYGKAYGMWPWAWSKRVIAWATATTPMIVVAHASDPDTLLGWVCGKPGLLHYVYVLHPARRKGLATELLTAVLGMHPSRPETRGTRMTHRPARQYRGVCNAVGWQWRAVTKEEIEA